MKQTKIGYSKREYLFYGAIFILILSIVVYGYLYSNSYFLEQKLIEKQTELSSHISVLDTNRNSTGVQKLNSATIINTQYDGIIWSEHIPKLINMLEELKNIDPNNSNSIILSDFKVNLNEISLNGKVSSLKLLYKNRETSGGVVFVSLIDKFEELEFLKDIRIQTYRKSGQYFEFSLTAKVINNDG